MRVYFILKDFKKRVHNMPVKVTYVMFEVSL